MDTDDCLRLERVGADGLPAWCDAFLPSDDPLSGRAWWETTIAHALPPGAVAEFAACGRTVMLPMLRMGRHRSGLTTPYTLAWRPLFASTDDAAAEAAGRALARRLRWAPPLRLDCLDPETPGLDPFLRGVAQGGLHAERYRHFGNWHEELAPGTGWSGYLRTRPAALRHTVERKLARAMRTLRFACIRTPGPDLERAIIDYESVRARSWKPHEPFPAFDAALMRAVAPLGALRLGVLRRAADDVAIAAQYWVVANGRATVLKLAHVETERAASPGTVLTAMMIRMMLDDEAVNELDFGRGDDDYKRLWVAQRRQRIGIIIADWRHPEGAMAIARALARRVLRHREDNGKTDVTR